MMKMRLSAGFSSTAHTNLPNVQNVKSGMLPGQTAAVLELDIWAYNPNVFLT